jgi:phage/plasmid-associated DNA primase
MIIIAFTKSVAPGDRVKDMDELLREEGEGILLLTVQAAIKQGT